MSLSSFPIGQVGLVGTLIGTILYVVRLVVRGELVPRKFHQELVNDRDRWREVAEANNRIIEQNSKLIEQNGQLIAASRVSVTAMQQISERVAQARADDEGAAAS